MPTSAIQTNRPAPAPHDGLTWAVIAAPVLMLAGAVVFFSFPELFERGDSRAALLAGGMVLALVMAFGALALIIRRRSPHTFHISSFLVTSSTAIASAGIAAITLREKMFRGLLGDASIMTIMLCLVVSFFGGLILAIFRKQGAWLFATVISGLLAVYGFLLAISISMGRWH